jgi:hypothetical protein
MMKHFVCPLDRNLCGLKSLETKLQEAIAGGPVQIVPVKNSPNRSLSTSSASSSKEILVVVEPYDQKAKIKEVMSMSTDEILCTVILIHHFHFVYSCIVLDASK